MSANLFLVGFMGSGKSSVGRELARLTGRQLVDTDQQVVDRAGYSIAEIFEREGEARFRALEGEVLAALPEAGELVVATGGGMVASRRNRRLMRARGRSVWLDVSFAEARRRVGSDGSRPLWGEGESLSFRALFARRRAFYALADRRVDGEAGDPARVAELILGQKPALFD